MSRDPLRWIEEALSLLDAEGLRRVASLRRGPQRPAGVEYAGDKLLNFGSNDYLGLAGEALSGAAQTAIEAAGWGSGASPLVTGRGEWHDRLERELAEFEGTPAALLFPSGYAANLGTIAALVGRGDAVFSDARNHASIIDGCRLSGAQIQVFPHRDAETLSRLLLESRGERRRLIVTDALFSMDGDLAPLAELADLAERFDAMLMVDEAHATGVFGAGGRGVSELLGVEHRVPVRVGTLSKSLGSIGGFVCGPRRLIDWLFHRARPYVFSTALPEAAAAAAVEALRIVREEPWRRQRLLARAAAVREELAYQGWATGDSDSQIIPLIVGEPQTAMQLSAEFRRRGLIVPGIRPPSVPPGRSLLRISLSAGHADSDIDRLLAATAELRGSEAG